MKRKMTVLVASTMLAITSASLPASAAESNPTGQNLAVQMPTEKGIEESQLATFGQADDINHFPDNTNHYRGQRTRR